MKYTGRLTITLPSRSDGSDLFTIALVDVATGVEVCEIEVSPENMAKALTARLVDCEFDVRPALLGKRREYKTENILVPKGPYVDREKAARAALAPHESHGWRGRVSDALNPHRYRGGAPDGDWYTVSFERYVEDEQ